MSILQHVLQPVLRPLLMDPLAPGLGDGLTAAVQALFASGEKGVMFDFSKSSNLYTDSARTTLVTTSGDSIGSATDLSPNGKHASSAGGARPKWDATGFATWDAFDDYMQTPALDFSGTDAVTVVVALRKGSDAAGAVVVEFGSTGSTAGAFRVFAPSSAAANVVFGSTGSSTASATYANAAVAAPVTLVLTGQGDISSDTCAIRVNGADATSSATDQGTGNYTSQALNIGARNAVSVFFNGRIYRLLVIGRALTATERGNAERWAAQPAGVTLA